MAVTSQDSVIALLGKFVQLRKVGYDRDDAWHQVEPEARSFSQRDVERLFALLRNWESTEGRQYKPSRSATVSSAAQPAPSTQPPAPAPQAQSPAAESRLKTLIRPLVQKTGLLSRPSARCPSCGQLNQTGEIVCLNCGQVLVGSHKAQKVGSTRPMEAPRPSTSYFGDASQLVLRLPESDQPVVLRFSQEEKILGRIVQGSVMLPDVDLTPFHAERYGVSRLHVSLRRHGDTLVISDLDSMNHTYVNGQRLHPHEVRVLNDGDEIQLGWMPIRVFFEHPAGQ